MRPAGPSYERDERLSLHPPTSTSFTESDVAGLDYGTLIRLPDGRSEKINRIKVGQAILGLDHLNRLVSCRVSRLERFSCDREWLSIRLSRIRPRNHANSYIGIACSPDQPFRLADRMVSILARDVSTGDALMTMRRREVLDPFTRSVMLGKLLGDGYLSNHNRSSGALHFSHRIQDRDYLEYTSRALGFWGDDYRGLATSGFGTSMVRARSRHSAL